MISQHLGKQITEEKRARWVALLQQAAADAGLPNDPEFRAAFGSYIEWGTRLAVENSQIGAEPPEHMPMPHWDWHTAAGPPGSRISALAPPGHDDETEPEPALPAAGETVRFEQHIKPLFRRHDRQSMSFAFDLWSPRRCQPTRRRHPRPAAGRHHALRWPLAQGEDRRLPALGRDRQAQLSLRAGWRRAC